MYSNRLSPLQLVYSKGEKERREGFSESHKEDLRLRGNIDYYKRKEKRKSGDFSLDEIINHWCNRTLSKQGLKSNRTRCAVSKDLLKTLCHRSIEHFPYITFNNFTGVGGKWHWASIDRIDSTKGYTDDNIVVIPLWLNSAKLDTTFNNLLDLIKDLPEEYLRSL